MSSLVPSSIVVAVVVRMWDTIMILERAAETTNDRGLWDDESRSYSGDCHGRPWQRTHDGASSGRGQQSKDADQNYLVVCQTRQATEIRLRLGPVGNFILITVLLRVRAKITSWKRL